MAACTVYIHTIEDYGPVSPALAFSLMSTIFLMRTRNSCETWVRYSDSLSSKVSTITVSGHRACMMVPDWGKMASPTSRGRWTPGRTPEWRLSVSAAESIPAALFVCHPRRFRAGSIKDSGFRIGGKHSRCAPCFPTARNDGPGHFSALAGPSLASASRPLRPLNRLRAWRVGGDFNGCAALRAVELKTQDSTCRLRYARMKVSR